MLDQTVCTRVTFAFKLIFHATELFNQSIVNTLLSNSISRHKHHFHRGAQVRCSKFNQFNLITVSRRAVSSSQTILDSSWCATEQARVNCWWKWGKISKIASKPKFQTIGRRLSITLRRYDAIRYDTTRHDAKSGIACRDMKKWFHRWIRCSRLVASENHYASFRVACRCNNALTCRGGERGGSVRARRHHKSIMAISAAIKSLQLLDGWIRNRIAWPAGETAPPSPCFYYTCCFYLLPPYVRCRATIVHV